MVRIRGWRADAWVVVAFGQKLGPGLLEGVFAVNLHASRLPRWRGASPIQAAILAGDIETGNSVITLAQRMDAGLILAQSRVAINPMWTAGDLEEVLAVDGPALVWSVLESHARGDVQGQGQDAALVTRAAKLSRADAWVRFEESAQACQRRIHGLNPWPAVTVTLAGHPVKLLRAEVVERESSMAEQGEAGEIVDPGRGIVRCGGGTMLRLVEVQPAGGRKMAWAEFARGRNVVKGDRLGSS
jgi:methionyl-tRNA formyltransferase